jgi:hypothetical protein
MEQVLVQGQVEADKRGIRKEIDNTGNAAQAKAEPRKAEGAAVDGVQIVRRSTKT